MVCWKRLLWNWNALHQVSQCRLYNIFFILRKLKSFKTGCFLNLSNLSFIKVSTLLKSVYALGQSDHSACLFFFSHALTHVVIFGLPCNWYNLSKFSMAICVLKRKCVAHGSFTTTLKRISFHYDLWGKNFGVFWWCYTIPNLSKLILVIEIHYKMLITEYQMQHFQAPTKVFCYSIAYNRCWKWVFNYGSIFKS